MSDGMSDSRREERAAIRIEQAAYELAKALKAAQDAASPWVLDSAVLLIVNAELNRIGLKVVPK